MDHVSFAVSRFTKESWVFLGLWTAFLSALNCQSQVNDSLFTLKQRKILYRCSTLNWFDFLHIILRLILRLNQVPFKENVLVATSAASLSFVYQNSKWVVRAMLLRHGQLSTRLSLFLHISPFKHTRCQRGSFCSSRIRKPSLLDLVPQKVLLSFELHLVHPFARLSTGGLLQAQTYYRSFCILKCLASFF